jgi:4-amino-4-deoxy-L-arabinose transferase-like glycosyltransferase
VTVLVAGPWYAAVSWVNGWVFVDEFLIGHNVERFTMDVFGHNQPFYFYVPVLLLLMFPWTFLLIPAFRRRLDKNEYLMVIWALVPFVFFSFSGSKLPAYILPMLAPLALLLAGELTRWESSGRFRVAAILEAAVWASMGVLVAFFGDVISVDIPVGGGMGILALSLIIAGGLIVVAWVFPPPAVGVFNVVTVLGLVLIITGLLFPSAQAIESVRPWVGEIRGLSLPSSQVLLYKPPRWMEYGLEFYLDRPAQSVGSEEELIELTESGESGARFFCISESHTLDQLSAGDRVAIEVVDARGSQTAFWVWQP